MATPLSLEDEYVKNFIANRSLDVDNAYINILDDLLSTLQSLYTGPVMIVTPNFLNLNLNLITEKIKQTTKPQYVSNAINFVSSRLTENQPRPDETLKQDKMYLQLKNSINDSNFELPTENAIPNDDNITNLRHILKDLNRRKEVPKSQATYQCYLMGKVLLSLKNNQPSRVEFLKCVKNDVLYSKSYTYFLIDFYLLCSNYTKLRTVSFPIRTIMRNFSFIKKSIPRDAPFWM